MSLRRGGERLPAALLTASLIGFTSGIEKFGLNTMFGRTTQLCAAVSAWLLVSRRNQNRAGRNVPLLIVGGLVWWAVLSVFWAESTSATFEALKIQLTAGLVALMAIRLLSPAAILKSLAVALRAVLVLAVAVQVAGPVRSVAEGNLGATGWVGHTGSKNQLGYFAACAAVVCWHAATSRRSQLFWTGFALIVLLGSQSATALVSVVVAFAAIPAARRIGYAGPQRRQLLLVVAGGTAMAAGFAAQTLITVLPQLLGKDPTLTGRTDIWTSVMQLIGKRPLNGYGLGGIWGHANPYLQHMTDVLRFEPSHAHNYWMDVALQLGIPMMILFFVAQTMAFGRLFTSVERGDATMNTLLSLMTIILMTSMTESYFRSGFTFMLTVLCLAQAGRSMPVFAVAGTGSVESRVTVRHKAVS